MSKNSRTKARLRRAAEKRKRKATNQAQYEQWRDSGQNTKSLRARRNSTAAKKSRTQRQTNPGNLGDYKAHFELNLPYLIKCLEAEDAGYKRQYSSKCPRHLVRSRM